MECFRLLFDYLAWIEHQLLSGKRDSRKAGSLWEMMGGVGEVRTSIHQSWLAKGFWLLCWGFKGVSSGKDSVGRGQHSSNRVSGISTRTIHQSTTPSLSQTIWPRWASRQFVTLPIVEILLPMTFGYSLSSEAVVMRQLRRWKRLWRRSLTHSHKMTSMEPSRSCWNSTTGRRRLLRRGLEFHVCTLNKSAHTKSLETYIMILVFPIWNHEKIKRNVHISVL